MGLPPICAYIYITFLMIIMLFDCDYYEYYDHYYHYCYHLIVMSFLMSTLLLLL